MSNMLLSKYSFFRLKNSSKYRNHPAVVTRNHKIVALKKPNKHKWEVSGQLWLQWEQVCKEVGRFRIQFSIIKRKHAKEYRVVHKFGILIINKEGVLCLLEIRLKLPNLLLLCAENLLIPMMILINKKMRPQ